MENNNPIFKISRESYGDNTVIYNRATLVAENKLDMGSSLSFNWGDTSAGSEALSYVILDKVGSREIANQYAKLYTKNIVSKIKKDDWTLSTTAVIQWINENTRYSIDENAYSKNGNITYEYEDRRQEDRRKEQRRIKREHDFQEEAQRRLKIYETRKQEDRRQEDRRASTENIFQEDSQKSLKEIQTLHQEELTRYKKKIIKQESDIEVYQGELKKYRIFIESLDIKSVYDRYCNLENKK